MTGWAPRSDVDWEGARARLQGCGEVLDPLSGDGSTGILVLAALGPWPCLLQLVSLDSCGWAALVAGSEPWPSWWWQRRDLSLDDGKQVGRYGQLGLLECGQV